MSRLSRAMKREQKRAAASAAHTAAPIDVRVPALGPGAGGASIGGVPVTAAAGEEIQQAVLTHLQRIAVASGHPVHATVHDERIGYVVPLRVDEDGSSHYTADPVRTTAAPDQPAPYNDTPTHVLRPLPDRTQSPAPTFRLRALAEPPVQDAAPGAVAPPLGEFGPPPLMDARPLPAEAQLPDSYATEAQLPDPNATEAPRPDQSATEAPRPDQSGTEAPRPDQSATEAPRPDHNATEAQRPGPSLDPFPAPSPLPTPEATPLSDPPTTAPRSAPTPTPPSVSSFGTALTSDLDRDLDLDPKPTPPRGFDAVAEAILGDAPSGNRNGTGTSTSTGPEDASPFAEPLARINEAVAAGRTAEAAELAERTVAEASAVLGLEHAEVLRMRELAAYIAYLEGEPARAFRLALDVAHTHHRTRDAEAAYGSIHGAATAWRAVKDPALGLDLGRDLLGLWTELMTEGGPAAEDIEELESVRARMDRLATRAAKSTEPPTA
ncbi:tetratricopeptide repeat protein [Streptomyces sp. M41]|uniref:tetratricopeptide repeat protein n=1 Tax=Streptomyces sp. M41 TaxID=3059412 RepID=UPI00374D1CB4